MWAIRRRFKKASAKKPNGLIKIDGPVPPGSVSDVTFYRRHVDGWNPGDPADVEIEFAKRDQDNMIVRGRGSICSCANGLTSITVRVTSRSTDDETDTPSGLATFDQKQDREDWLPYGPFSLDTLCLELSTLLGLVTTDAPASPPPHAGGEVPQRAEPAQGLLLVTGPTNSGKSRVAQGLIHHYLEYRLKEGDLNRRLHLVTCEDPVETYYRDDSDQIKDGDEKDFWPPEITDFSQVDYTPRSGRKNPSKRKNKKSSDPGDDGQAHLSQALEDALRQTPSVFYAGELRGKEDLKSALDFASTGHFIVGTAHAGSLTEAFDLLLSAAKARNPAKRGQVVQRVLGVIHQTKYPSAKGGAAIIPTLWRNTSMGIASMVSEGLSSIVPNNPPEVPEDHISSLGRLWFARRLLTHEALDARHLTIEEKYRLITDAGLSDIQGI